MAAPHVAGVCSLMKAVNPGLTPDQIKAILQNTAFDLGTAGRDDFYGHGFVLADRAVAVAASVTPATQLVAYTGGLTFDGQTSLTFTIGNAGGTIAALGALSYSVSYGSGSGWITGSTITALSADYSGIGVTVSTGGLSDGTYTATFTQHSANGGSVAIPITLRVLTAPPPPPFTEVYVLLINADTDEVVDQYDIALPSRTYSFTGIPPGRYYVVAGTDLDNDDYIDDPNEYFGIYHNAVDSPVFTVEAGVNRLGFNITLTQQGNPG
jgi:serine protease